MKGKWKIKSVPETTANLQTGIVNFIKSKGQSALRINTQGQWDEALGIWRKSGSRKGVFDIIACVHGRFVAIDVKKGDDFLSKDQIEFMYEVRKCGGLAITAESYEDFLEWWGKTFEYKEKES